MVESIEIPGYSDVRLLGRNGHKLFWGRCDRTSQGVVIHVVDSGGEFAASVTERLQCQFEQLSEFDHPGILKAIDRGEVDGLPYFAFEEALSSVSQFARDRIHRVPVSDLDPIERLVTQVVEALDCLRDRGCSVVHLEPGQMRIDAGGNIKFHELIGLHDCRDFPEVYGSLNSLAPEQLERAWPPSIATDVYRVGAFLYSLLTGTTVYHERHGCEAIVAAIRSRPPQPVRKFAPAVPVSIAQLCSRCLAKLPSARPGSPREVLIEWHIARKCPDGERSLLRRVRGWLGWH